MKKRLISSMSKQILLRVWRYNICVDKFCIQFFYGSLQYYKTFGQRDIRVSRSRKYLLYELLQHNQFTVFLVYLRTIHLCERKHNHQKLVVKQISTDLQGEQLRAAKNEVAILKSLQHPNIIKYYDSFTKNGIFYIVMEYACKGNLYELIYRSRPNYFAPQVSCWKDNSRWSSLVLKN